MKLLYCANCRDIVLMRNERNDRRCFCGRSSGRYVGITKMVIHGPYAHVLAFANPSFEAVRDRVVKEKPGGRPRNDYQLRVNHFTAWFFGPNATKLTRDTKATDRDRVEVAAEAVIQNYNAITNLVEWLSHFGQTERMQFVRDLRKELRRLAPLSED